MTAPIGRHAFMGSRYLLGVVLSLAVAACGGTVDRGAPAGDAGAGGDAADASPDAGRKPPVVPDEWLACERASDCTLVARDCCPAYGPIGVDALTAVRTDAWGQYTATGCVRSASGAFCAFDFDPGVVAICKNGQCAAVDAAPLEVCTVHSDCALRTRDCCECGGDVSPSVLLSLSDASGYRALACSPGAGCPECAPAYPANQVPYCDPSTGRCGIARYSTAASCPDCGPDGVCQPGTCDACPALPNPEGLPCATPGLACAGDQPCSPLCKCEAGDTGLVWQCAPNLCH